MKFELYKNGPLMCTVAGSWTSYSLMIYDVRKLMVCKAFISSQFVFGHIHRGKNHIYGTSTRKQAKHR